MKTAIFLCSILFLVSLKAFAAPPVLFYSDLTSGPNSGGKDNKGAWVTVFGNYFGDKQGDSFVTVGGKPADNYVSWENGKICFQLGVQARSGDMQVTTAEGVSNGIRFIVRPGRIYFVDAHAPNNAGSGSFDDPWRSPRAYFTSYRPGDICYFREGTYEGVYGNQVSRPYNISFYNTSSMSGAPGLEVAWVGYPCEAALFKADDDDGAFNGVIELISGVEYHVFAGLRLYGRGDAREQVRLYSDHNKLVNCDIEGIKTLSYGMIGVTGSNLEILGNDCHGARSANKLDHIIYFQGSGENIDNVDIGWNRIYDNDIAVGPVFSWNINKAISTNVRIHDNFIDCRGSSGILRLAGMWSGGGGSVYFYNNVVVGSGGAINNEDSYNAFYIAFGTATIYNNTFYRSKGAGENYVINVYDRGSAVIRNNIFYNLRSIAYINGPSDRIVADHNCYYGGYGRVPSFDRDPLTEDPKLTALDPSGGGLRLDPRSPCIGIGADTTTVCPRGKDGALRPAGAVSCGAY